MITDKYITYDVFGKFYMKLYTSVECCTKRNKNKKDTYTLTDHI